MNDITFSVARQFTRTPGARYEHEGDYSGESFRREYLAPLVQKAISEAVKIHISLDGTAGYGTSFLEEAFGGLVREEKIRARDLRSCRET
jgi:hypothetical protein